MSETGKDAFWDQEIEISNSDGIMDTITQRQYHDMCAAILNLEKANAEIAGLKEDEKESQEALDNSDIYLHEALDRLDVPSSKLYPGQARDGVIARVEDALKDIVKQKTETDRLREFVKASSETDRLSLDENSWDNKVDAIKAIILDWLKAYPTDIFLEPPKGEHAKTVDGCSAHAIRYCCRKILEQIGELEK